MCSEFADSVLSDSPSEIDERRQSIVNQTRIGAKVLDALLDASSAWSQKAVDVEPPNFVDLMETSDEESDEALNPPKRKKAKKSRSERKPKPKTSSSSASDVYKKSLEKMKEGEIKEAEANKKKKKRSIFRRK